MIGVRVLFIPTFRFEKLYYRELRVDEVSSHT